MSSLTGLLVGVHAMLALQTKCPELELSDFEGKEFAKAAQNVMRHYSVQTTQKTIDWIALIGVSAGIYGTRALAVSKRVREERQGGAPRGDVVNHPMRFRSRIRPNAAPVDEAAPSADEPSSFYPLTGVGDFEEPAGS